MQGKNILLLKIASEASYVFYIDKKKTLYSSNTVCWFINKWKAYEKPLFVPSS